MGQSAEALTEAVAKCRVIAHPLVQHKLTLLRDRHTHPQLFRTLVMEISLLLAYEIGGSLKTQTVSVETPLGQASGQHIADDFVLVSIMRAGNAMLEGMMQLLGFAPVGHIGLFRDKKKGEVLEYFFRMPPQMEGRRVILLDPMLASATTAIKAVGALKNLQVGPIDLVTLVASRPGLERLYSAHPDVQVMTLTIEPELDAQGWIIPGLGDAGDRIYGT